MLFIRYSQFTTNSSNIYPHYQHIWLSDGISLCTKIQSECDIHDTHENLLVFVRDRASVYATKWTWNMQWDSYSFHFTLHHAFEIRKPKKTSSENFLVSILMTENIINGAWIYSFSRWQSTWNLFGCHEPFRILSANELMKMNTKQCIQVVHHISINISIKLVYSRAGLKVYAKIPKQRL